MRRNIFTSLQDINELIFSFSLYLHEHRVGPTVMASKNLNLCADLK